MSPCHEWQEENPAAMSLPTDVRGTSQRHCQETLEGSFPRSLTMVHRLSVRNQRQGKGKGTLRLIVHRGSSAVVIAAAVTTILLVEPTLCRRGLWQLPVLMLRNM